MWPQRKGLSQLTPSRLARKRRNIIKPSKCLKLGVCKASEVESSNSGDKSLEWNITGIKEGVKENP